MPPIAQGNARALLARQRFIYDIKRYVGEFLVLLGGLDALVFTGGIGQKDAALRKEVMEALGFMGVKVDDAKNAAHATVVTAAGSTVAGLVLVDRRGDRCGTGDRPRHSDITRTASSVGMLCHTPGRSVLRRLLLRSSRATGVRSTPDG